MLNRSISLHSFQEMHQEHAQLWPWPIHTGRARNASQWNLLWWMGRHPHWTQATSKELPANSRGDLLWIGCKLLFSSVTIPTIPDDDPDNSRWFQNESGCGEFLRKNSDSSFFFCRFAGNRKRTKIPPIAFADTTSQRVSFVGDGQPWALSIFTVS